MLRYCSFLFLVVSIIMATGHFAPVLAQTLPGSADPSRIQSRLPPPALPSVEPPMAAEQAPPPQRLALPEGADQISLTLSSVELEGMSVYRDLDLQPLYQSLLGKKVTVADIFSLADKITTKYRNDGYILSQAFLPPQEIDQGRVVIKIIEGYIHKVTIQGDARGGTEILSGFAQNIKNTKPLDAKTLERNLLLMNDIPGISVKGVVSASPAITGAADLTLVVTSVPIYAATTKIDNRGSRYAGPLQINAGIEGRSLLKTNEKINLQVMSAPDGWHPRELDYLGASYTRNLGYQGVQIVLGGSVSSSAPGYRLEEFDIKSLTKTLSLALTHPLIRSRDKNLILSLKFDTLDSEKKDNLSPDKTRDHLRILKFGSTWQSADLWGGVSTIAGEISKGIDLFGASKRGDANMTRAQGAPDFTKISAEISRLQNLSHDTDLLFSATGQKSSHMLLSSEEFGIGGASYGSAYDSSEITGENGFAAKIELRYNAPPEFFGMEGLQFYSYYDIGKTYDPDNAAARDRIRSLASTGIGLRFDLNENISTSLEWAKPLTRAIEANGDNHPRLFGDLSVKF